MAKITGVEYENGEVMAVYVQALDEEPRRFEPAGLRCCVCEHIRPKVDPYTHEVVGAWCSLLDLDGVEENDYCSFGARRDSDE